MEHRARNLCHIHYESIPKRGAGLKREKYLTAAQLQKGTPRRRWKMPQHTMRWSVSATNGTNVVGQNSDYDKSTVTGNTFLQLKVSIQMMKKCQQKFDL